MGWCVVGQSQFRRGVQRYRPFGRRGGAVGGTRIRVVSIVPFYQVAQTPYITPYIPCSTRSWVDRTKLCSECSQTDLRPARRARPDDVEKELWRSNGFATRLDIVIYRLFTPARKDDKFNLNRQREW